MSFYIGNIEYRCEDFGFFEMFKIEDTLVAELMNPQAKRKNKGSLDMA